MRLYVIIIIYVSIYSFNLYKFYLYDKNIFFRENYRYSNIINQ